MKALKIVYRITTMLIVIGMAFSVYNYFFNPSLKTAFLHLGFPDWFRIELAIAKLLGALALGIPIIPSRIKEWAYVGFFINFFSAFLSHNQTGDPILNQVFPLIMLVFLTASYVTFHKAILLKKQNTI